MGGQFTVPVLAVLALAITILYFHPQIFTSLGQISDTPKIIMCTLCIETKIIYTDVHLPYIAIVQDLFGHQSK